MVEIPASGLSVCVAVVDDYLLNRRWTFRPTGSFAGQPLKCTPQLLGQLHGAIREREPKLQAMLYS